MTASTSLKREERSKKNNKRTRKRQLLGPNSNIYSFRRCNKTCHCLDWMNIKYLDRDSHWYSRRIKEAIQIRLHPNNINRNSGIKFLTLGLTLYENTKNEPITKRVVQPIMETLGQPITVLIFERENVHNKPLSQSNPSPDKDSRVSIETPRSFQ